MKEAEAEMARKSESYIEGLRAKMQQEFDQREREYREKCEQKVLEQSQRFGDKQETDNSAREIKRLSGVMNELGKQTEQLMANLASIAQQSKAATDARRASQEANLQDPSARFARSFVQKHSPARDIVSRFLLGHTHASVVRDACHACLFLIYTYIYIYILCII